MIRGYMNLQACPSRHAGIYTSSPQFRDQVRIIYTHDLWKQGCCQILWCGAHLPPQTKVFTQATSQIREWVSGPDPAVPSEPELLCGKDLSRNRAILVQTVQCHRPWSPGVTAFDMEVDEMGEAHRRLQTDPPAESKHLASSLCWSCSSASLWPLSSSSSCPLLDTRLFKK